MGCETGSWHPPLRVSIAARDGDGRVKRYQKGCTTTRRTLPRGCAPLLAVDRPLPPRGESKCARSGAPTRRFNTAVEADEDRIFAHFHNPRLERTHLHPFLAFGVAAAPRSRRSPPMSRSSLPLVLYAVPAPANRQTESITQKTSPLGPLSSSASGSADVGRPPGALRHVTVRSAKIHVHTVYQAERTLLYIGFLMLL